MKTCTKCGKQKPATLEYFRKHSGLSSGLRPDCKDCQRKQWKKNYPSIAEAHRKRTRKYAQENKEKVKAYHKKWHSENAEYVAIKRKEWNKKNRFMVVVRHKYWRANRKARERGVLNDLTREQIKSLFVNAPVKCAYCGVEGDIHSLTIDHIVPFLKGGPNTLSNIAIACPTCNAIKGERSLERFLEYTKSNG